MNRESFFSQPGRQFFFENPVEVAKYVRANFPRECEGVIAAADDVAGKIFKFNLRWDMERTWSPIVFDGDIDWLHQPAGDPEWVFAFNRMRFWIVLGQAYALTGDEKYAEAFASQLCHWVRTVKADDPACAKAWRSIEVGLRLEYWLKAVRYFAGSPALTEEVIDLFIQSVTEQAEFIMGVWNSYNIMSNWGVLSNHGLFLAGVMLPQTARTAEFTAEAVRRLAQEIQLQVYRDGVHWEQSPMYHNEVLHCYLDVVLLAQRNGVTLPETLLEKTRAMCRADVYASKPDHCELSMGDSDNIDQRDIITKGAVLFNDGLLRARGCYVPDFDAAWDLGEAGLARYKDLKAEQPAETDYALTDSGNFYFRSGWGEADTYVHLHCGTLGAGHGHADKLHIDIFSRGEDLLMDAGRFTYVFDEGRVEFKELRAHNTLMVDGRDIYRCKDSWECHDLARGVNRNYHSGKAYSYAEGGHTAYMKGSADGVLVNRRVIFLKPDIIVVADEFYTCGAHSYNQFFHFGAAGALEGGGGRYTYKSNRLKAEMVFMANGLASETGPSQFSRHYNLREQNTMITTSFKGEGFTSAFSVFSLSDPGSAGRLEVTKLPVTSNFKGITFEDSQIEALNISVGERRYTVVVAHEEYATPTDTFLADGCMGFGSCVVFDRTAGETEIGNVLLW